jgi:acyl-CoA thioester hydrolase
MLEPYNELKKAGMGWADDRQLIEYKHEVPAGALLVVRTTLKRLGNKSVEYRHELRNAESDVLHSTSEQVTVLFDLNKRAAAALDDAIRARGTALGVAS